MIFILFGALACQHPTDLSPNPDIITVNEDVLTVEDIRNLFDSSAGRNTVASLQSSVDPSTVKLDVQTESKHILWDFAFKQDGADPNYPVIIIPVKNADVSNKMFPDMNPNGYRLLAFQHTEDKKRIGYHIRDVHPDEAYVKAKMKQKNITALPKTY